MEQRRNRRTASLNTNLNQVDPSQLDAQRKLIEQEEQIELITDAVPALIAYVDRQSKFQFANRAYEEWFKKPRQKLVGRPVREILGVSTYNRIRKYLVRALGGRKVTYEREIRHPDGSLRQVSATYIPDTDDDGYTHGFFSFITDITERKKADGELRRLQFMVDSANISLVLIGEKGQFLYVNKYAHESLGYDKEEFLKLKIYDIDKSFNRTGFKKLFNSLQRKQVTSFETEYECKNGKKIPVEVKLSGVKFEGRPYMFCVSDDISERKDTENKLQFLATSSNLLGSSLDYETTLASVAQLSVPHIADWCSVDMLNDDGQLELLAVAHVDPKKVEWAQKLRAENPTDMKRSTGAVNVIRTGKPAFYPVVDEQMIAANVKSKRELELIKKIGDIKSSMIVPITVKDETIGTISFVSTESQRRYDKSDLHIAEQLAERAALAIENSQLYMAVAQERERLENIVLDVPGVVWEAYGHPDKAQQRIDFVSKYVEKMLGYTVEEWLSTPNFWLKIVHPDDKEKAAANAASKYQSGESGTNIFRWISKDGKEHWVEARSSVIKDDEGKAIGMRGVTMDIGERIELEKRKEEFIGIASHELKTPLTSIKGYTQILERVIRSTGNSEAVQYISKMNSYIDKLNDLISDLLDASKIQAGKLDFKTSTFDFDKLVSESVDSMQALSPKHDIEITGKANVEISGDRDRLEQVFTNLIANGIKYSPNAKKILVTVSRDDHEVKVGITDYGIGIAEQYHQQIFQKFYRVATSEKTYSGLGIGLHLSYEIIKRHGGNMSVDSKPGKGSTFYFTLPINQQ